MRIIILASRFPYPIEKGDKLRLYHQLKGLSERHEIHLIALNEIKLEEQHIEHLHQYCSSIHILNIGRWQPKISLLKGLVNGKPFQVQYFFNSNVKNKITNIIATIQPDVIYCQLIRMADYVKDLKIPKVLDYMDAFSLSARRRVEHDHFLSKLFFTSESKRVKSYEKEIVPFFNQLTIISFQDYSYMQRELGIPSNLLHLISNGLDTKFFKASNVHKEFEVAFVGNMGYRPNILAAHYLIKKVLPKVDREVSVQIAGTRPVQSIRNLATKNIVVTGWMNDIRDAYNKSTIFVAPIFTGAGQQNKILEAMSMGLPCITTVVVNESIKAKHGEEIFVAHNEDEFASYIKTLLADEVLRQRIGKAAQEFVKANFSWEVENKKLEELLIKATNGNGS